MDMELLKKPTLMGKYEVNFRTRTGEVISESLGYFGTMDDPEKAGRDRVQGRAGEFISVIHVGY